MKRLNLLLICLLFFISCGEQTSHKEKHEDNIFYDKAFEYRDNDKMDSAFLYFNKAKDKFLQQRDSLGAGKCLLNMAIISTDKGDFYGGQELSLNAISFFDKNNKDQHVYINSNFNNLGIATYRLEDYKRALNFYDLAIKFSKKFSVINLYLNNKANTYQELRQYQKAIDIYDQILKKTNKNQEEYSRVLTNISFTKWLQNPNYNAIPDLLKGLHLREHTNDFKGQNASYAHLSDYYAKKNTDSALWYAKKMLLVARKISVADDQLQALQKIIRLSSPAETKQYFETYQKLDDSVEHARNAASNKFALIRYETEKSKADNLVLQKDNTDKKYQIIILIFSLLVLVVGGIFWYKKRKQRLELETKNTIRNSQLKTSKKVHDVVANGLYRVMAEIENQNEIDKEGILDRLENMYEKSRDISYEVEQLQPPGQNFDEKITALLNSFATENTKVTINGNSAILWAQITPQVKSEIEHILQELMVNMKKHSKAKQVTLYFVQQAEQLHIYYADDGLGLPADVKFKNGLTNTGNRMASIDGTITFDTNVEQGLKIQLSFPVS